MIIERHPAFYAVQRLAQAVVSEHVAPRELPCDASAKLVLELYRFLTIKQLVLRTRPSGSKDDELQVSPGYLVDRLWHAVLLESEVREELDALLGGHVPHSAADARLLTDEQKLARQLTALNLMALEGWTPHLPFWEQPGTAMHRVEQVQTNGTTLFFARGMPVRDVGEVTRSFLSGVRQYNGGEELIATMDAARAVAASVVGEQRAPKRPYCAGDAPAGSMRLFFTTLTGRRFAVDVPAQGTVAHIMQAIAASEGIPAEDQRLVFDGKQLYPCHFLDETGLVSGSRLMLLQRLKGC